MKVVCDGLDLSVATSQVIKAISNRTTNQVLEGIKLEAKGDKLKLSATDLELAIQKTIKAEIKEEGETVIPGRFFSEFIKVLLSSLSCVDKTYNVISSLLYFLTECIRPSRGWTYPSFIHIKMFIICLPPFAQVSLPT